MPKIYVFLNALVADIETWVAVAEDGYGLASHSVPIGHGEVARMKLGKQSKWVQNYNQHYPDGYELEVIENIDAPENIFLLNRIRKATEQQAEQRAEQYRIAREVLKVRTATVAEVEAMRAQQN